MNVLWLDFLLLSDYKHYVFTNTNMTIFYSASLFYSKEKPKLCRIMHKGHGPYGERPAFKLIMLLQLQGIARFFRPGLM